MELTYDETLALLDELEQLTHAAAEAGDGEVRVERIGLVLDSLDEAPSSRVRERLSQIRGWAEVLLQEEEPGELASIRTLIFEELAELRDILEVEEPRG